MYTTVHKSRHFKKTTWQAGALSALLSELLDKINSKQAEIKFTQAEPGEKSVTIKGGPEQAAAVTELPVGQKVLTAQYIRERGESDIVSNVDILSLDMLTVDVVSLVFNVTADEYQVDVRARDAVLADSIFQSLIDHLSLDEISQD
jgi:hypothetical protein